MADFSAVIRRAIEGLSSNTPEERGRIYGRARATIQRQLDSLPDGMNRTIFEAQLVKIENSILEIEQEYADAVLELPAQEDPPEQDQVNQSAQQPSVAIIPEPTAENIPAPVEVEVIQPEALVLAPIRLPIATSEIVQSPFDPSVVTPREAEGISQPSEPEPIAEIPVVELQEIPAQILPQEPKGNDTSESIEVSPPTRFESLKSAENAIDSELRIPSAPQHEAIKPSVSVAQSDEPVAQAPIIRGRVEEPVSEVVASDNDANLIDQAVNEIRSTLMEGNSDKPSFTDPNLSFGFGEEALPEAPAPKPRKSPIVIVIAVLLLIFVALAFFFWRVGFQGVQDLIPQSTTESTEISGNQKTVEPEEQLAQVAHDEETATSADEIAIVSGEAEKFTQRLNSDGSEIDEGPASDLIDGLPNEEGRSVASADISDDTNQSEPITAQADDGTPTLQKMFFYETSLGLEQQARYEGSVVWSEKTESDFENSRPYIEGTIQVPERDLSLVMTIKLNGDVTLPVSHLIDLNFSLPEEFDGGEIEQITEVKFKTSEEQTGDRLEAITAKIDTSFFVVGLQNDKLDVVESNLQLMSQRGWIDIPISYTNGRKALITLEKGTTGKAIFDKVLASWSQNPVQ